MARFLVRATLSVDYYAWVEAEDADKAKEEAEELSFPLQWNKDEDSTMFDIYDIEKED
jgi:hypothetical protein